LLPPVAPQTANQGRATLARPMQIHPHPQAGTLARPGRGSANTKPFLNNYPASINEYFLNLQQISFESKIIA
jgi:hypothetical protein